MSIRLIVLLWGFAAALLANPAKKSADLDGVPAGSVVPVMVQYHQAPSQADLDRLIATGASVKRVLPRVRAIAASIPASAIDQLAADPKVKYISLDRAVKDRIGAPAAAAGAVVDLNDRGRVAADGTTCRGATGAKTSPGSRLPVPTFASAAWGFSPAGGNSAWGEYAAWADPDAGSGPILKDESD